MSEDWMPRKESFRKYEDPVKRLEEDPMKCGPHYALANTMHNTREQALCEQERVFLQDLLIVLRGIKASIEDLTASVRRAR